MKKHHYYLNLWIQGIKSIYAFLLTPFLIIVFNSCQEENISPEQAKEFEPFSVQLLQSSAHQTRGEKLLQTFQSSTSNQRTSGDDWTELDWESANVTINHLSGVAHYAFLLPSGTNDLNTTNLIIQDLGYEFKVYRLRFVPSELWLAQQDRTQPFQGEIQLLHWNDEVALSSEVGMLQNGRTTSTVPCFVSDPVDNSLYINWDECGGVENWENPDESSPVETIISGDPLIDNPYNYGSGGGGGSGGSSGSGTDHVEGSGSGSSGSGSTGSGDGGNSGGTTPIDMQICFSPDSGENCVEIITPVIEEVPEEYQALMWAANNVELDSNFENTPCVKEVFDSLMDKRVMHELLKGFNDNDELKVVFRVGTVDNNDPTTRAYGETEFEDGVATITISSNMLGNSDPRAIAAVLLHEMIHAEILRALYENDNTVDLMNTSFWDLVTLFSDYQADEQTNPFHPLAHHAIMIERYQKLIRAGLFDFTGQDPNQYNSTLEALSWGGLLTTVELVDRDLERGGFGIGIIGDEGVDGALISLSQIDFYKFRLYSGAQALFQDGPCP